MKKVIIQVTLAVLAIFAVSCSGSSSNKNDNATIQESSIQLQYTCPMHPEVISDKAGSCPKCGMVLVVKE